MTKIWTTCKSLHLVRWDSDLIETYFIFLESYTHEFGDKMTEFIRYLRGTYFKLHMRNGQIDPLSYVYWSWGQDYETYHMSHMI